MATAAIGLHPNEAWLSLLVNFKSAIWTWGHFRRTICNTIQFETWKICHRNVWNASDCFGASCMNRASVFERHKRFKEGRESVRHDERFWRSKEDNSPQLIGQRVRVEVLRELMKRFRQKRPVLFKSWHFHQDNAPVHNSILITDYLTKMGIKTVPQPHPCSPDLAPCDFLLLPKLTSYRYEPIEEMKEVVTKFIDTLTQEDVPGAF